MPVKTIKKPTDKTSYAMAFLVSDYQTASTNDETVNGCKKTAVLLYK